MVKILITGGSGFLGHHLVKVLSKKYEIIIDDIVEPDLSVYPKNVSYHLVDIRNKVRLNDLITRIKPDIIIHAAAALPLYKKKRIFDTNVLGTRNVLDSALKNKVKKVIFISSTAVYGVPKKHPIYETDPMIGVGAYGSSKILAEKVCNEYRKKGQTVTIIRPKTFIGPERLGVFQILYDWVEHGKRIPIIGSGLNHYQLLEVRDLVDAIELTIKANIQTSNDTYNIGAEKFNTVYEDVTSLCKYSKSGSRVMKTPASLVKLILRILELLKLSPLYKWIYGTADTDSFVSIDKFKKTFNWSPKYSNSDALIESYKWYLDHKDEIKHDTGVTHRVAWDQGLLGIIKRFI